MTIINMTPHSVHIMDANNVITNEFPASGNQIRLKAETVIVGALEGVPITRTVFGEPVGLPDTTEGTYYIVSQLVKSALPFRKDLLVPAEVVRNEKGVIIGCKSLGV